MSLPWLGYHRISRIGDRPDTDVSEGEFSTAVEAFAASNGFDVELLPVEKDQTGSKLKRPILDGAIRRIEAGEASGLIVVRFNRLSRATVSDTHLVIERIEAAGGQVRSVSEDYPDTPEGRMARNMAFGVSRMQWEVSAAFIRAAKERAVRAGIWPFPQPPPGYTVTPKKRGGDGKLKPGRASEVRRIRGAFEAKARNESLASIATGLGIGLSHAGKILTNRAYLGEIRIKFKDGGEIVNPAGHEALIDRALFEAAQRKQPRPPRNGNPRALLAGLVRCGHCGGAMTPGSSVKGGPHYKCPALPRKGGRCDSAAQISQRKLDPYVERIVLPHVEDIQARARERTADLDKIIRRLGEAEAERDLYQQTIKLSDIGADAFLAGMESRQADVDRVAAELGKAKATMPELPDVHDLGALYGSWDVEKRNHLLRGALSAVVVMKGRGPCQGRVTIETAGGVLQQVEGEVGPLRPQ